MIDAPTIVRTGRQQVAAVHVVVPRAQIRDAMGPGIQEVFAALGAQGIAPAGPLFTHHFRMAPDVFDFEICVPVSQPCTPVGRVKPGELPAATAARTIYRGPYEGLGAAWGEFQAWIRKAGHTPAPDIVETYLSGPESSANPEDWRTELSQPLVNEPRS